MRNAGWTKTNGEAATFTAVTISDGGAPRNVDMVPNLDLAVHREATVVPNEAIVANVKLRIVEETPALDAQIARQRYVVSNEDLGVR